MPQMMPLYWTLMILTLIPLLIICLTYLYYFYMPIIPIYSHSKFSPSKWNWKW